MNVDMNEDKDGANMGEGGKWTIMKLEMAAGWRTQATSAANSSKLDVREKCICLYLSVFEFDLYLISKIL